MIIGLGLIAAAGCATSAWVLTDQWLNERPVASPAEALTGEQSAELNRVLVDVRGYTAALGAPGLSTQDSALLENRCSSAAAAYNTAAVKAGRGRVERAGMPPYLPFDDQTSCHPPGSPNVR